MDEPAQDAPPLHGRHVGPVHGRVLVAGGFQETFPYVMASAEIYDPAAGA